jgi:hypothetical protein
MCSRVYRNHVIIAFPSFDTATNAWAPQADVSWSVGASREFAFIKFPARLQTEGEAINWALDMAQGWVDDRLSGLRSEILGSGRGRVIDIVGALKQRLGNTAPSEPRRSPSALQPRGEKGLTFEQFKSAIAAGGLIITEQALQKSYAALVKLRKNERWSWAETRRKLEQSKREFTVVGSTARRPRAARLPLTERDWRRIG